MTHATFKRLVALGLLVILLTFFISHANATGNWWDHDHPHEHESTPGTNGIDGVDGQDGADGVDGYNGMDIGISSEEFAQGLSMAVAGAGMDFTSTTSKLQLGVSASWYDGENGFALGVAQVIDSEAMGDVLYSVKIMGCNGCSKTSGVVSAVWNIQ